MNLVKKIIFLIIIFMLFKFIYAQEYDRFGESFRSLSMGNTGVASAKFGDAMFYNPAALANSVASFWDIAAIHYEFTDLDQIDQFENFGSITTDSQKSLLEENLNEALYYKVQGGSNFKINFINTGLNFGGNYYTNTYTSVQLKKINNAKTVLFEQNHDTLGQLGFAVPLFSGALVLGYTYRTIYREHLKLNYMISSDASVFIPNFDTHAVKGSTTTNSIGMLWRLPFTSLQPTLGYAIQNLNGAKFDNPDVPDIKEEVSYGITLNPVFGHFRYFFSYDVRDIGNNFDTTDDQQNNEKRTHIGAEIAFSIKNSLAFNTIAIRAGLNQGHYTYGAEISIGHTNQFLFGYANYAEEIGNASQSIAPRRSILYISVGL